MPNLLKSIWPVLFWGLMVSLCLFALAGVVFREDLRGVSWGNFGRSDAEFLLQGLFVCWVIMVGIFSVLQPQGVLIYPKTWGFLTFFFAASSVWISNPAFPLSLFFYILTGIFIAMAIHQVLPFVSKRFRKTKIPSSFSILLVGCLLFNTTRSEAQIFGVGNATEWTQLLNYAQLVQSYLKQAETAAHALQTAQIAYEEGKQLVEHPSTNIFADLASLSSILVASQGLAGDMASMDHQFRQTYGTSFGAPDTLISYADKYRDWSSTSLKTVNGAMNAAGYQGTLLQNEQLWMRQIQTLNQSPQGRNEALQLGNTVAIETVSQLQKLRQLMIADMESKAAITGQQISADASKQNANNNSFLHIPFTSDRKVY